MAQFTKTNGDLLPVINFDSPAYTNSGANAVSTANTVQPQGPKLDFFTVTASGSSALTGTQVSLIIQATQQLATVYIYEFTTAGPDTLAMAVYPVAAWTTTTLNAAVVAAFTAGGAANTTVTTATATFTG
jgi:queuine/archaeosine tRNA-ribosyltransferase